MCDNDRGNFYEPPSFAPCERVQAEQDRLMYLLHPETYPELEPHVPPQDEDRAEVRESVAYRMRIGEADTEEAAILDMACQNVHLPVSDREDYEPWGDD